MKVDTVINNNQSAWQEVSLHWNDEMSQRFHASVMTEMDSILKSLNAACEKLETETAGVTGKLTRLDAL